MLKVTRWPSGGMQGSRQSSQRAELSAAHTTRACQHASDPCRTLQAVEGDAEKPEDWEHEEERADDDVDMGDEGGSEPGGSPVKRCLLLALRALWRTVIHV